MPAAKPSRKAAARKRRLAETIEALTALQFAPKQRNKSAACTLLALLDLRPNASWSDAQSPLLGITPIIEFITSAYEIRYKPNTREMVRKSAIHFFVAEGLVLKNPDDLNRPINSDKTAYQIEPTALALFRRLGTPNWTLTLLQYLASRESLKHEIVRKRNLIRVPVIMPDGVKVTLSPGGQNPLVKQIIEQFCPAFAPGGVVIYIGDTESKSANMRSKNLAELGVTLDAAAKIPDVILHDTKRNWLLLIEAVTSDGPVDGKRRKELKDLFAGCKAGLVFVTAFGSRRTMQKFISRIAWESEVWIAEDPDHMIHFNGDRFLGPYPDVLPTKE